MLFDEILPFLHMQLALLLPTKTTTVWATYLMTNAGVPIRLGG